MAKQYSAKRLLEILENRIGETHRSIAMEKLAKRYVKNYLRTNRDEIIKRNRIIEV